MQIHSHCPFYNLVSPEDKRWRLDSTYFCADEACHLRIPILVYSKYICCHGNSIYRRSDALWNLKIQKAELGRSSGRVDFHLSFIDNLRLRC